MGGYIPSPRSVFWEPYGLSHGSLGGARIILLRANLAPLPKSASHIKVYTWSTMFSGAEYLRFQANPADIVDFVDASKAVSDARHQADLRDGRQLYYVNAFKSMYGEYLSVELDFPSPGAPDWFQVKIPNAKHYLFFVKGYQCPGELIIDGSSGTVFIKLVFG